MKSNTTLLAAVLLAIGSCAIAEAAPVTEPQSSTQAAAEGVLLTVEGRKGKKTFSVAALEALGMKRITTSSFWPDDDGTYEGPLLVDVLREAGLDQEAEIRVLAEDNYSSIIPQEDWKRWPVILATRRDGKTMTRQEKGPLRIVYPRDMDPSLKERRIYVHRWVWMAKQIDLVGTSAQPGN